LGTGNEVKAKLTKHSKGTLQSEGWSGEVIEISEKDDWNGLIPVTQFGLQRSGTNLTRMLLMRNYNAIIPGDQKSWKHGFYQNTSYHPVSFSGETHILVTIKNPFAWLVSIYNYSAYHRGRSFSEFVRTKYAFEGLANYNPVVHWNTMHQHWLNLVMKNHEVAYVKYEDLLSLPQSSMDGVAMAFNLTRNDNEFYVPKNEVCPDTTEGDVVFNKDYYLSEKYMNKYTKDDIDWVVDQLDHDLFGTLYPGMCEK